MATPKNKPVIAYKDYEIYVGRDSFDLYRKTEKGKSNIGYYPNLKPALRALIKDMGSAIEVEMSLKEFIDIQNKNWEDLKIAIKFEE